MLFYPLSYTVNQIFFTLSTPPSPLPLCPSVWLLCLAVSLECTLTVSPTHHPSTTLTPLSLFLSLTLRSPTLSLLLSFLFSTLSETFVHPHYSAYLFLLHLRRLISLQPSQQSTSLVLVECPDQRSITIGYFSIWIDF